MHMYMHTCMHTCTHTCMHACTYTHTHHTRKHCTTPLHYATNKHTHTLHYTTQTHTYTHTHTHTQTHILYFPLCLFVSWGHLFGLFVSLVEPGENGSSYYVSYILILLDFVFVFNCCSHYFLLSFWSMLLLFSALSRKTFQRATQQAPLASVHGTFSGISL